MKMPTGDFELAAIWGSSATDIYAVGKTGAYKGAALHYDGNGDGQWSPIALPTTTTILSLRAVGGRAGDVYFAGQGQLLHGTGTSGWKLQRAGTSHLYTGLSVHADGTAFAIGARGILIKKP